MTKGTAAGLVCIFVISCLYCAKMYCVSSNTMSLQSVEGLSGLDK